MTLVFSVNDFIYPRINAPEDIKQGNSSSGIDGLVGKNGVLSKFFAKLGVNNGNVGVVGQAGNKGNIGNPGDKGGDGKLGDKGVSGDIGKVGEIGLPSNSKTGIVTKYKHNQTDSYTLQDFLTYGDTKYLISFYTNIENTTRFILTTGENIVDPEFTVLTGVTSLASSPSLPITNPIKAGTFYSNLRIAIGYGRGDSNSKNRSDDTIFYVSPPISRKSYLFSYNLPATSTINDAFGKIEAKFPINVLGNTKEFFYFKSVLNPVDTINHDSSVNILHLMGGIAKYEIVVNTFPPLPSNIKFNYRIIEEFNKTSDKGISECGIPTLTLPFDSSNLIYKDTVSNATVTISPRCDINKVVERSLTSSKVTWIQTNKTGVEIVIPEEVKQVKFENTYHGLKKENDDSIEFFKNKFGNIVGYVESLMITDKVDLKLIVEWENIPLNSPCFITFGCERYVPSVPLHKYNNLQKLYIKFNMINNVTILNNLTGLNEIIKVKNTLVYGKKYSFDLIDFKTVYSKVICIPRNYDFTLGNQSDYGTTTPSNRLQIGGSLHDFFIDSSDPIEIGYTTYQSEELYTQIILPQYLKSDPSTELDEYYITVPLYGYKKK